MSEHKIFKFEDVNNPDINKVLDLIALFVHDLEGPTAVMQSILKLLDEGRLDLSKKYHSDLIVSGKIAMDRARSIIGDLTLISKSSELGLPFKLETLSLSSILRNSIELIRPAAHVPG